MADTTLSTRQTESYSQLSAPPGPGELVRDGRSTGAARISSAVAEAARLLLDGEQLLQESRPSEAEPLLLRALELYERENELPAECVQLLGDLASIAVARGDLAAAEPLLQRALTLASARFGGEHPNVAAMLGSLARLYLRRTEFAKAEPLLQRLLDIKRAKGDDHAEVATVLASLATVHSAMGAHASSEQILRRVLAIREKTLAPNHFATMTTLEHLAEACAARGKFDEALTLLHRALVMRERTLGGTHASLVAARARISDLELLSSNEDLESAPIVAPVMASLPAFEPRVEDPGDSDPLPPQEPVAVMPPALREVRATLEDEWDESMERTRPRHWLLDELAAKAGLVTAFARTPRGRLTVLAIGVASLLGALILAVRTRGDVAVTRADASVLSSKRPNSASPRTDAPVSHPQASPAAQTAGRVVPAVDLTRRPTTGPLTTARRDVRPEGTETEAAEPVRLPNPPRVRAFDVPVDRPLAPVRGSVVASTDFTPPASRSGNADGQLRGVTLHAVLPADNPAPQYPPELLGRRIEGRVVAEFVVDERGRVDTRTLRIISSTHERFSEAVRELLPNLRFTPAEVDGVRTEERVQMPFRFSPKPQ